MFQKSVIVISLFVLASSFCQCDAYPEPSLVPAPNIWTLDVEYSRPYQITAAVPDNNGNMVKRRFWYIILTLTNQTPSAVDFYPSASLVTDTFDVVEAGDPAGGLVFRRIKLRHQGRYPFLEHIERVGQRILSGKDNTVDVAVIWPDFDTKAKNVRLYIEGLSNETAMVLHPSKKDENGNPIEVYLQKTLELQYSIAGDPRFRDMQIMSFRDDNWVMR